MKTVYKYPLEITGEQTIALPRGARLLYVAQQGWELRLWAMHDIAESRIEERKILIHGTGHEIQDNSTYIGTALMDNGLVWHVFEAIPV